MKSTHTLLGWVIVAVLSLARAVPALGNNDADSILEALQKRYETTVDFKADFQQITELKTLNRTMKALGKVYFRRPGKMLWRYQEPKGQVILADGKYLYYYEPEEKQVIKSRLSKAFLSDTPLSFMLGIGDLKRDFNGSLIRTDVDHYVVQLVPKEELGGVGQLRLGVTKDKFDILWAEIEDAVGNVTTIRFSDLQREVGLGDSLFRLEVPDDVDIIEMGS
ncbi:MAG: hypothetical protein GTO40_05575 [Deltaproteobacteria bacterium]|nr:hypothetical protein [Deltaproteobacteria bacterium]